MTSDAVKKGLPTWAKILIGLVIAGTVLLVAVVIGGFVLIGNIQKDATNPAYIEKVTKSIVDIQALPPGYNYQMALDIGGLKTVVFQHKPDGTQITLVHFPQASTKTSEEMTTELVDKGFPAQGASGKFEVTSKGTETVAGQPMSYVLGTATNRTGTKEPGMIGTVISPDKTKTLMIYGSTPGDKYNMDATKAFLSSIKGF
jgi:hypothetical protein